MDVRNDNPNYALENILCLEIALKTRNKAHKSIRCANQDLPLQRGILILFFSVIRYCHIGYKYQLRTSYYIG